MAAKLKQDLGLDAELVIGNSGEFTIWVDSVKVSEKSRGVFPEPDQVVAAVRAATP